jgi:NAD(P)-dependent dehydrogenase (short-subunit alcohol dehydrogenase family)
MTVGLAKEVADEGIPVNAVAPRTMAAVPRAVPLVPLLDGERDAPAAGGAGLPDRRRSIMRLRAVLLAAATWAIVEEQSRPASTS